MQTSFGAPDPLALLERAKAYEEEGWIDPLSNLLDDQIYVFSGTEDETVTPSVVDQTVALYHAAGLPDASTHYVDDRPAGHGFITEGQGGSCGITGSPFINDCGYDQAGDLLAKIYGPLDPLIEFDQNEFLDDPTSHGLDETGFVYVPTECTDDTNTALPAATAKLLI